MPSPDDQPRPQPATRRPRSFARRWIPRLLVAVITLLVVVIVTAQIVFTTALPKQIVLAQVEKTLGLRVNAASLTTSWLGHTTLRDVQVSLPLSAKAFCTVRELRVSHTNLPLLALTQSITIYSIDLDRPIVTVTQDHFGRWNVQDVAELLLKLGGQGQAQQTPDKSSPFVLPDVGISDGDIEVTDNQNRHASLTPLVMTGHSENLVWTYDASMNTPRGKSVALSGRVVPSNNFTHEVKFEISGLAPLLKPWIPEFDPSAKIGGSWKGAVADGGVNGRLLLDQLQYATVAAEHGDFTVRAANGAVTVGPSSLSAHAEHRPLLTINVTGGSIRADATAAKVDQLNLTALGGQARLDGTVTFADLSGKMSASWNQLHPAKGVDSTGSFTAAIQPQWPARHAITAQLVANGSALGSPYSTDIHINAAGSNWDAATMTVDAPTLRYDWKTPVRLDGLVAHLVSDPGKIALTDVSISHLGRSAGTVAGSGALIFDAKKPNFSHYDWWAYFSGQNLTVPPIPNSPIQPPPVAGSFDAWGNQQDACLRSAYAVIGSIFATADGVYHITNPKPVDANVFIAQLRTPTTGATTGPTTAPSFVQGHLRGDAHLTGTIAPLDLALEGQLHGRGLILGDRPLDNVDVKCTGTADRSQVVIDSDELHLLGGQWKLHAQMPGKIEMSEATVQFHDVKLVNVAELAHQSDIAGTAAGMIDAELSEPSIDGLHATGTFSASTVQARQLQIDSVTGNLSLQHGEVSVTPIHLTHGNGHADASLRTDLAHPTVVTATLDAADWPVDAMAAHALLAAKTDGLVVNAATQTVAGRLTFGADVDYQQQHAAMAKGAVTLSGQTVNLDSFNADALGGTATGTASFTLAAPLASRAEFHWTGLNLNSLSPYEDRLRDAGGSFAGQAVLAPVSDKRALAPLLLTIDATGTKTHVGPVQLSGWHFPIWLNKDPGYRMVLDDGRIDVADGSIGLFARVSQHLDNILTAQADATLHNLDIDQLINEVEMSSSPTTQASPSKQAVTRPTTSNQKSAYPGRLSGQIDANGDPRNLMACSANIALKIHDSDLANFGPFAALYNVMHLGGGPATPSGAGTVNARYDNDNFIITSLYYFNRGVYAYGDPRVDDIRKYPECPQSGSVAGTFRPLENLKLPFFADADQIFSVLQSNFSAVALGGTVDKPTYRPQSVADLGSALKRVLIGDTQAKHQ